MLNSIVALLESGAGGAAGSYESIATVTAAGGEASLSFTSIPSTYKHLQIRGISRFNGTSHGYGYTYFRINGTGGTYTNHYLQGNGSSASATSISESYGSLALASAGSDNTTSVFGVCIIDIIDYASTTKNKTVRCFSGMDSNNVGTYPGVALSSSLPVTVGTTAVTSFSINAIPSGEPFVAGSTFALYGIKGA